ncbi:hypothetical protein LTR56_023130 [Elasticomyces elasticus]|nr:hypothetical protein LTR56_023130 [Elasticomyces elasticus]KAK3626664.1 hypothetical protein LTR22_023091 [Elasticomyces elasticus]KAK4916325.1 hypothetical protein LTR49_015698 [Elasticomyces elasticus]KAK5764915.1 hypothetical protein LTS12_004942 [Elasticomyces elasticus]
MYVADDVFEWCGLGHFDRRAMRLVRELEHLAERVAGGMTIGFRGGDRRHPQDMRWASERMMLGGVPYLSAGQQQTFDSALIAVPSQPTVLNISDHSSTLHNMVQYSEHDLPGSKAAARDYWKLGCRDAVTAAEAEAILIPRGFDFKPRTGVQRLRALLSRSDRSLCTFEHLTIAQLRQLCKDRKLPVLSNASRDEFIAALEQADDKKRFPRFLDLPPKVRVFVYAAYVQDLEQGTLAVQPPVTMLSKELRTEALPVFYDSYRFGFFGRIEPRGLVSSLHPTDATEDMIRSISNTNLPLIQKLCLHVPSFQDQVEGFYGVECDIDLGGKDRSARVEELRFPEGETRWNTEVVDRVEKRLADMSSRPQGKALQERDVSWDLFHELWWTDDW